MVTHECGPCDPLCRYLAPARFFTVLASGTHWNSASGTRRASERRRWSDRRQCRPEPPASAEVATSRGPNLDLEEIRWRLSFLPNRALSSVVVFVVFLRHHGGMDVTD